MKPAILVIDMLNDFVTGKLKCERAQPIIPNIKKLLEAARKEGIPIFYLNDAHSPEDYELGHWGEHAMEGSEGAKVIPELSPQKGDFVLGKRVYSGFFETPLDSLLRAKKVDAVVITGLHTHMCCRHTAADAFFRGYKVVVPDDCLDAFTEKDHLAGLEYFKAVYCARLTTAYQLCNEWAKK